MFVVHGVPSGNGNSIVYTMRVNGVSTALSVSVASTSGTGSNTSNSISVAQGDYVDIEVTKAASIGSSPGVVSVSVEFAQ